MSAAVTKVLTLLVNVNDATDDDVCHCRILEYTPVYWWRVASHAVVGDTILRLVTSGEGGCGRNAPLI